MTSKIVRPILVFCLLVALGVWGRFVFQDTPNFTPTVAVALFAGFYFQRRLVAICVPLFVMGISNLWLESYASWGVMFTVYAAFTFPVFLRSWMRRSDAASSPAALRWASCFLAPSLVFYLTTNLAVWYFRGFYEHTVAGLMSCYVQALPFYQWSLQADLLFVPALFGTYFAACTLASRREARLALSAT